MKWGNFTIAHILTLIFAVILNVVLYFILKRRSKKIQIAVLGILSFSGIAAIVYNLVMWNAPLEYLPFHLCSLNAMILPFAVLTRNKMICNLTLLWSLGAACALVLNNGVAETELFGHVFMFYFFPHVFEMSIPILLFKLKLVKLDAKCVVSTVVITLLAYIGIHFINLAVNNYAITHNITYGGDVPIEVNYMYSISHDGNPVLAFFYNLLPYKFWYMLPIVPIVTLYLGAIYGINHLIQKKKNTAKEI